MERALVNDEVFVKERALMNDEVFDEVFAKGRALGHGKAWVSG